MDDDLGGMFSMLESIEGKAHAMEGQTKMGGRGVKVAGGGKKGGQKGQGPKKAGQKEEAERVLSVPRDEALIHEFRQVDVNGDGYLSADELFEGLQQRCWGQDEISGLFDKLDANKDSRISLDEFLAGMQGGKLLAMARFIPFEDFRAEGVIPRRGHKEGFTHPLTGQPNKDLARPRSLFDEAETLFIFVSHRWLRPGGTDGHPDDAENSKHRLIVEAVERLLQMRPMLAKCRAAVWIDFGCVDQDLANPAAELNELHEIIQQCDALLTPVHDPEHAQWELPAAVGDWYSEYQAAAFQAYWRRAWCVVEAMAAACMPVVPSGAVRGALFREGGAMGFAIRQDRRPHVVYGSKESAKGMQPRFFPPLLHANLVRYDPPKMELTSEKDRETITRIAEGLRAHIRPLRVGWDGGVNARGQPSGRGRYTLENGDVYEGELKDGKKSGKGKFCYASGSVFEGAYKDGKKSGRGVLMLTSGAKFEGEMRDDRMHGHGVYAYANGDVYDGAFRDDKKSGRGEMRYGNGDVYDGEWKGDRRNGLGTYSFAGGGVYMGEWADDKKNGKGKMTHKGGQVEEGMWKDGSLKK